MLERSYIIHLIWLGKTLGSTRRSWKTLRDRGTSGLPCLSCCSSQVQIRSIKMDGPFNTTQLVLTAYVRIGMCASFIAFTHSTHTHSPVRDVSQQTEFSACCWCRGQCKPAHSISQAAAGLAKGRTARCSLA